MYNRTKTYFKSYKFRKVSIHYIFAFGILAGLLLLIYNLLNINNAMNYISASAFAFGIFQVLLNRAFQNQRDFDQLKLSLYNKMENYLRDFKLTINKSLEFENMQWRGNVEQLININNDIRSLIKFNEESFFPSLRNKDSTKQLLEVTEILMKELDIASIEATKNGQTEDGEKLWFVVWNGKAHEHMPNFINTQYEFLKDFQETL